MENARTAHPQLEVPQTARAAGLVACRECGKVYERATGECSLCGQALHSRKPDSIAKVWAWLIAGMIIYIPANTMPMLQFTTLGHTDARTIFGGVLEFVHHGSYGVAFIIFFASMCIPVGKFIAIGYLALSVQHRLNASNHTRLRLYEVVEFIGRWSMIDVFVVAILSALVQLGFIAAIAPGIAAVCFALSVAFTMISAQSFDPRMIWDDVTTSEASA